MDPARLPHRRPATYAAGEVSVTDAAARLGCSTGVVYYWIDNALLHTRRGSGNRLCITWNEQIESGCRARIAASGHLNRPAD